jgi:hypothetical protein
VTMLRSVGTSLGDAIMTFKAFAWKPMLQRVS